MKFNKIYIAALFLMTALFVACDDYEDNVEQSPAISVDNPAVRFASENATVFELDPAISLEFTLTLMRDNETAALEAPVTVVTNTENSFIVPEVVSFAAGDKMATLTIRMADSAPTGVDLPIEIAFGENYASPYKVEYSNFIGSVSVVKWNNLGTAQFYDSFSFYKVAEVTLEQRDDKPEMYRINTPYSNGILLDAEWDGWLGGTNQEKITFIVDEQGGITWNDFWYTSLLYQGNAGQDIKAYEPAALEKDVVDPSVVVKNDADAILYFELHPSIYIDGVGGYGEKAVYLGFPGFDLAGALGVPVYGGM